MKYSYVDVAQMIDHSLLKPNLSATDLEAGCRLALEYQVASVCVLPYYVLQAVRLLRGSPVLPTTTIGFPHGGQTTPVKLAEAKQAIDDGARELDMVVNISAVLSGEWGYVRNDIASINFAAHYAGCKVKVIFENCYLNEQQKIKLCTICGELDVDWAKTSTGFGTGGATLTDVELMRQQLPTRVQVKAAGGIRDLETVLQLRQRGVTRIGTSNTAAILDSCRGQAS
ncbi:MAG: deoxyribose-phosphate aldolase [Planctomycetota bacterium]